MCQLSHDDGAAATAALQAQHCRIRRPIAGRPWTLGRLGKLHIGTHGLLGLASLLLTSAAIGTVNNYHQPNNDPKHRKEAAATTANVSQLLLALSQLCNAVLIRHAHTMLPQVPLWTQILPGIIAPHQEAFRRTIAVMEYLIARVALRWIRIDWHISNVLRGAGAEPPVVLEQVLELGILLILLWHWWPMVPNFIKLEWWNGNTWIFVVPIFFGITGDLYQYIFWGDCVSIANLLTGQLLGLCLAFGFTLGFRNYLPMPVVYGLAALAVWCIIQEGIVTIRACQSLP